MSENINKLAYIIHGEINPNEIFTHAIAHIIGTTQKKKTLINQFSTIQALYNSEYRTKLPESIIKENINQNFFIKSGLYELNTKFGISIDEIEENFVKSEKDFSDKLNSTKNKFYCFYKTINKDINKKDSDKLFAKFFLNSNKKDIQINENEEYSSTFSNDYVIKQMFLKEIIKQPDETYDILQNIEISNSICSSNIFNYKSFDYSKIKFYLDTPILLKLLGYDGIEYKKFLEKFFKAIKCKLCTFEHTVEETWGILYAWKSAYNQNNFTAKGLNLYLEAKKQFGSNADEIIPLDRVKLKENLDNFHVLIEEKPELTKQNCIYSEDKLVKYFEEKYKSTYDSFPDRIQKDIDSISGIQALRIKNGILKPEQFESACYYFLTDNKEFAGIAEKNYKDQSNSNFCEVQYLDTIVYKIWTESGKEILPPDLFKLRCLTSNSISEEFRNDFSKIVNRIESLEHTCNVTDILIKNPEYIEKAHDIYITNNKSIKDLTEYLSGLSSNKTSENEDETEKKSKSEGENNISTQDENKELKKKLEELQGKYDALIKQNSVPMYKKIFEKIKNFFRKIFK